MRYLVGYVADETGPQTLALAQMLARSDDRVELTLCIVLPESGVVPARGAPPSGYDAILRGRAEDWLAEAREMLPGLPADTFITAASSPASGLAEAVRIVGAGLLVVGSARHGPLRRLGIGSVADQLLHSSPVPVAVAPLGFAPPPDTRLERVSCGFVDQVTDAETIRAAAQLARRNELPLRLVTVVVAERPGFAQFGPIDDDQLDAACAEATQAAERACAALPAGVMGETTVAAGSDLAAAFDSVDWLTGEVLFVGSSRLGSPARVFLGSTGTAMVRHAPVAVVVVPRGAEVSLDATTEMPVLAGDPPAEPQLPTGGV